jgi:UDP-glucose 4-epimerase
LAAEQLGWRARCSDLQTIICTAFAWQERIAKRQISLSSA